VIEKIVNFTLKACARVAAATDGEVFDRVVVIFLKRTPQCIRAAKLGVLWPIRETGDARRRLIGRPLLLIAGVGLSTC